MPPFSRVHLRDQVPLPTLQHRRRLPREGEQLQALAALPDRYLRRVHEQEGKQ